MNPTPRPFWGLDAHDVRQVRRTGSDWPSHRAARRRRKRRDHHTHNHKGTKR